MLELDVKGPYASVTIRPVTMAEAVARCSYSNDLRVADPIGCYPGIWTTSQYSNSFAIRNCTNASNTLKSVTLPQGEGDGDTKKQPAPLSGLI